MKSDLVTTVFVTSLYICSAIVKGVFGDRWDPLPARVRNVVSSNHLAEGTPRQVFAEYHALLPNYRGDYGVKSELINAASEEPVYKGKETLLLPLYIPHGAVPLSINERRVRSGKAGVSANMRIVRGPSPSIRDSSSGTAVNRPTRRVVSPFRRPPSGSRPMPTPPAAYLRTWMKKRAESTTSAPEKEDNVEEIKRNKPKILSQLANFRNETEVLTTNKPSTPKIIIPSSSEIESNFKGDNISRETLDKESARIKKITTRLENRFSSKSTTRTTSPITTTPKTQQHDDINKQTVDENLALENENIDINNLEVVDKKIINTNDNKSTFQTSTTSSTTIPIPTSSKLFGVQEITTNKPVIPVIRRRPLVMPKSVDKVVRKRMKPVVPTRNTGGGLTTETATNSNIPITTTSTTTVYSPTPRAAFTSLRIRNKTQNVKVNRVPDWMERRRESIIKENNKNKEHSESYEQKQPSESIIDRVLNSAATRGNDESTLNQENETGLNHSAIETINKPLLNARSKNRSIPVSMNKNKTIGFISSVSPDEVTEYSPPLVTTFKPETTSPPYRKKIPLRTRAPIVSNPMKSTRSMLSSTATTTTIVSTTTDKPEVQYQPQSTPDLSPPLKSYTSDIKTPNGPLSTNLITTSTPKLPFNFATNPSSPPRRQYSIQPFYKGFRFPSSNGNNSKLLSPTKFMPITSIPRMKSPQDIVLEKLSELMKNATKGSRDNLEIIIQEIENLNKELASMGIHIIDAEFDGHKIKLKDQENHNRSGVNLSGATTIRYVIPNTNNRKKYPQEEIIKHGNDEEIVDNEQPLATVHENKMKTSINFMQSSPILPRSTQKPETTYFTLRHSDEYSFEKTLTSPFPSILNSTENLSPSQPTFNGNHIPSESSFAMNTSSVFIRTTLSPEHDEPVSKVYVTTTVSSTDTTRTRSTLISITTPRTTRNEVYVPITSTKFIKNVGSEVFNSSGIDNTPVYPTAHLRPEISKTTDDSSNVTRHRVIAKTKEFKTENPQINRKSEEESQLKAIDIDNMEDNFPLLVAEYETAHGSDLSQDSGSEEADSYIYLIGILGIVPCGAALFILYRKRQKQEKKSLPQSEERAEGFTPPTNHNRPGAGHNDTLDAFPGYIFESSLQRDSPWELSRSKLRLTSIIGEGNFGIVWKAEARNICDWDENGGPTVLVAVKGVKEGAGAKEKSDLLTELSIMQHLGQHANIVTLLGCCTTSEPYHLVMEYVMFGKLLTFLREQRSKNNYFNFSSDSDHLTSRDLTKFASQIATGCEYLQSRGVIHRDLAARNILVDHNKICKIADFGLARSVKDMDNDIYEQKSKGPLPIRWMSPESLYMNIFTHKSDVWSFGILCWEIVTLGSTPYPGISAREVMRRVREGYRLERPEHCRPEFYRIVAKCWHQDLVKRASFTIVKDDLRDLLDNYSGWIDLENFQESDYYSMHENNEEKL